MNNQSFCLVCKRFFDAEFHGIHECDEKRKFAAEKEWEVRKALGYAATGCPDAYYNGK